jgi:hypothetical protein
MEELDMVAKRHSEVADMVGRWIRRISLMRMTWEEITKYERFEEYENDLRLRKEREADLQEQGYKEAEVKCQEQIRQDQEQLGTKDEQIRQLEEEIRRLRNR